MSFIYNLLCKRTSTYVVGIFASVFVFERAFDMVADGIFESHNKGVRFWELILTTKHNLSITIT